jgi:hypothetical protein
MGEAPPRSPYFWPVSIACLFGRGKLRAVAARVCGDYQLVAGTWIIALSVGSSALDRNVEGIACLVIAGCIVEAHDTRRCAGEVLAPPIRATPTQSLMS